MRVIPKILNAIRDAMAFGFFGSCSSGEVLHSHLPPNTSRTISEGTHSLPCFGEFKPQYRQTKQNEKIKNWEKIFVIDIIDK
jgi:hypothetical protein